MKPEEQFQIQESIKKLSKILSVAAIDIECIGCKKIYPDFIFQLISRLNQKSQTKKIHYSNNVNSSEAYQHHSGQIFNMDWEQLQEKNIQTTVKAKYKLHQYQSSDENIQMIQNSAFKGDLIPKSLQTPQTKRYRYNMGKANAINLAADKKYGNADSKEIYDLPQSDVKVNELSSAGKFVFGRSGFKWGKGDNFPDVQKIKFYESSESNTNKN